MFKYFTSIRINSTMLYVHKEEEEKEEEEEMEYYSTFPINLIEIEATRNEIVHLPDMHVELFVHFIHSHSIGNWRLF